MLDFFGIHPTPGVSGASAVSDDFMRKIEMQLNVKKTNQAPVLAAKGDVSMGGTNGGVDVDMGGGGNVNVNGSLGNGGSASVTYTQTTTCC